MRSPNPLAIYARYSRYLAWEFRWPLGVFSALVLLGGMVLQLTYHQKDLSYAEACYGIFLLIFLEPYLDFPNEWYLQPVFFLVPIIGLTLIQSTKDNYAGLWYPMIIAGICFIVGAIFIKETKDNDMDADMARA